MESRNEDWTMGNAFNSCDKNSERGQAPSDV